MTVRECLEQRVSARRVGILAFAQHHADRHAGQVEALAQAVDQVAPVAVRQLLGLQANSTKVGGRALVWVM